MARSGETNAVALHEALREKDRSPVVDGYAKATRDRILHLSSILLLLEVMGRIVMEAVTKKVLSYRHLHFERDIP